MKRHALKRYTVRLLTALTAAAAGVSALPAVRAAAATETVVAGIYGDLNGDQKIDLPDVRLMQEMCAGEPYGVLIKSGGQGMASSYIDYEAGEEYYMCFGKDCLHKGADGAAAYIASVCGVSKNVP